MSELLHKAEEIPQTGSNSPRLTRNEHGYLEIVGADHTITSEMVSEAAEDLYISNNEKQTDLPR